MDPGAPDNNTPADCILQTSIFSKLPDISDFEMIVRVRAPPSQMMIYDNWQTRTLRASQRACAHAVAQPAINLINIQKHLASPAEKVCMFVGNEGGA